MIYVKIILNQTIILNGDFMSNNSKTKNFEEIIVTLEDIDVSDEELGVEAGTKHAKKKNCINGKALTKISDIFKFEKAKIALAVLCILAVGAALTISIITVTQNQSESQESAQAIKVTRSKDYDDINTMDDAQSKLYDYDKSEKDGYITYKKDNIIIEIKCDENSNIIYRRYENRLTSSQKAGVKGFDDSMIEIGMSMEKVLKVMGNNNYIYNLSTKDEDGRQLDIYYYGWDGQEPLLKLTFIDGTLDRYMINSKSMEGDISIYDFENE